MMSNISPLNYDCGNRAARMIAQLLNCQRRSVELGASRHFSHIMRGASPNSIDIFIRAHGMQLPVNYPAEFKAHIHGYSIVNAGDRITVSRKDGTALSSTPDEFEALSSIIRLLVRTPGEKWGSGEYVNYWLRLGSARTPTSAQAFMQKARKIVASIEKSGMFVFSPDVDFEEVATWRASDDPMPILHAAVEIKHIIHVANKIIGSGANDCVGAYVIDRFEVAQAASVVAELERKGKVNTN